MPVSAALKFRFIRASAMRGPRANLLREQHCGFDKIGIRDHAIDDAQQERVGSIERLGRIIELPRLAGADEFGEKVAATKVAGKSDIGESGEKTS